MRLVGLHGWARLDMVEQEKSPSWKLDHSLPFIVSHLNEVARIVE
jgi:hypothetical protein